MNVSARLRVVTVMLLLVAASCVGGQNPRTLGDEDAKRSRPAPLACLPSTASRSINAVGFDLYRKLAVTKGNLFFSPLGVVQTFGMAYAGARGETRAELGRLLHFGESANDQLSKDMGALLRDLEGQRVCELRIANAAWQRTGFPMTDAYRELVTRDYCAKVGQIDIGRESVDSMNQWVAEATKGKVSTLVQPEALDERARLVLLNAIYFKGKWRTEFDPSDTEDRPFTDGTTTMSVPTMRAAVIGGWMANEELAAVELPYTDGDLSMILLLPRGKNGLPELEKKLTAEAVGGWLAAMSPGCDVRVSLPRFQIAQKIDLKTTFVAMGMRAPFRDDADFSGISGNRFDDPLCITSALHEARVDVNETGTEAAAATEVGIGCAAPPHPVDFEADHPFVFLIVHKATGAVLFLGRLQDPRATNG